MRIPQRLDYAMRTLVLLAGRPPGTYTPAGELARLLRLPKRFVEQQVSALSKAGIVQCRAGSSGGCTLETDPARITALDVVVALQGGVIDVPRQANSAVAQLWQGMSDAAAEHLASVTLADLLEQQRDLDDATAAMYYI